MAQQRLQLTWFNKDKALIPTETGKYGYTWVDPSDPRYCETHALVMDDYVHGVQTPKSDEFAYSERADLAPQDDNLMILGESGDVLEALTRVPELAEKYVGKVKLIYIDPPFNTAQTFASYEDNLEHSIWLTMMRDRLLNMKRLLAADGSIWVHLDQVEVHRMRLLLDETFGADCFVTEVIWGKADTSRNDAKQFSVDQDYLCVYSKRPEWGVNRLLRTAAQDSIYKNPDGDRVPWIAKPGHAPGAATHQGMVYAIQSPFTGELLYPPKGGCWRLGQDAMLDGLNGWARYERRILDDAQERAFVCGVSAEDVRPDVSALVLSDDIHVARRHAERALESPWPSVFFINRGKRIQVKGYLPEGGTTPRTIWSFSDVGSNRNSKAEIKRLFPDSDAFSTPKPERLLERIIHIGSNPGDIVLDVFAGSGTTAAVAQKMGRRWVTCELLESTFTTFTRPRLEKVVNDEDPGGITRTKGERIPADDVDLPEGVSAEDAAIFTSVLNKLIADDPALKKSADVKTLKAAAKTRRTKDVVNWRGGGGFQVAHLSPACFDYDPDLDRVMLTAEATGETLVESVAANLGFRLLHPDDDYIFDAQRGNSLLKVIDGVATIEIVDSLVSHVTPGETIVLAATSVMDGVREHLRRSCRGSRVVALPDDVFHYTEDGETR
ncbi:site-specific DNA-methyltransferase [Acidipropionibacterium virtanenii]|uniref:Modification methylase MboII n=1 Tax=Acidipropionibacterium virtanenii TaxID=2057246 RepID=A0A344UV41_9ACTN|nr:site-specific DNA-methyltransferase [Acidipropionibacterium virtanenii]AXE39139.1 Modification methylase MboII [Acidipropionibacterium virtanenii]